MSIKKRTFRRVLTTVGVAIMVGGGGNCFSATGKSDAALTYKTIHKAAKKGDLGDVKRHMRRGVPVNKKTNNGSTPLHVACTENNIEIVKQLLSNGADPNTEDAEGWTPLHVAADQGRTEVVQLLLRNGANIEVKTENNRTPLEMANTAEYDDISKLLRMRPNANVVMPKITTDIAGTNGQRYMSCEVVICVTPSKTAKLFRSSRGDEGESLFEEAKARILNISSQKNLDSLLAEQGREEMTKDIKKSLNKLLTREDKNGVVSRVDFASFLVQ